MRAFFDQPIKALVPGSFGVSPTRADKMAEQAIVVFESCTCCCIAREKQALAKSKFIRAQC